MPCYDGTSVPYPSHNDKQNSGQFSGPGVVHVADPALVGQVSDLKDKVKWYEAALCALITEFSVQVGPPGLSSFLARASIGGKIDLVTFWSEHQAEDESRLKRELDRFSEHERAVLFRLLLSDQD